jgi:small-conductance mechanosensitive channel
LVISITGSCSFSFTTSLTGVVLVVVVVVVPRYLPGVIVIIINRSRYNTFIKYDAIYTRVVYDGV